MDFLKSDAAKRIEEAALAAGVHYQNLKPKSKVKVLFLVCFVRFCCTKMSKPAAQAAAAAAARAHAMDSNSGPGGSPSAAATATNAPVAPGATDKPEKKRGLLRKSRTTWLTKTSDDPVPFPAPETSTSKDKTDLSSMVEDKESKKSEEDSEKNEETTQKPPEIVTEVRVPEQKDKPDTPNARPSSSNMEVIN